jgi:hypothetical protein
LQIFEYDLESFSYLYQQILEKHPKFKKYATFWRFSGKLMRTIEKRMKIPEKAAVIEEKFDLFFNLNFSIVSKTLNNNLRMTQIKT